MPGDLGQVSPYLFGANLLWANDAGGAFDPATGQFYPRFVREVKDIGITSLRYPGGTTSDSFVWERAIGPMVLRQPNEAYGVLRYVRGRDCCLVGPPQPSDVGPDQFGRLLGQLGASGMVTVNFDTGTPQQAAALAAYMTAAVPAHPSSDPDQPSYWAALRAKDGHPAPYDVPYWEVGNEQNFLGQSGWRSGAPVRVGAGQELSCPPHEVLTCLYAFGGTTAFYDQPVGTLADNLPEANISDGLPGQKFYTYFPPLMAGSQTVYVGGQEWFPVGHISGAGPGTHVYQLVPSTGELLFGNGRHGAVPAYGSRVYISYTSGPHAGFDGFYAAIKRVDPNAQICEAEQSNVQFLALAGHHYHYDCIELHEYAKPRDTRAPLPRYEEQLMAYPAREARSISRLEREAYSYSGRQVPVVVSEYGQLIAPMPVHDPRFGLSLDEGLLVASQLMSWARDGVPVAEKYLLAGTPSFGDFEEALALDGAGLSVDSGLISGPAPTFVLQPDGYAIKLVRQLAGSVLLPVRVNRAPEMRTGLGPVHTLNVLAGSWRGSVTLVVVNGDPGRSFTARLGVGAVTGARRALVETLKGRRAVSYNTPAHPNNVSIIYRRAYFNPRGWLQWTFPAHSLTVLKLGL